MPGVIPPQRLPSGDFVLPFAEVHENEIETTGCETHWSSSLFPKEEWTEYIECEVKLKDPLVSHAMVKPCRSLDWQTRNQFAELLTFGSHNQMPVSD